MKMEGVLLQYSGKALFRLICRRELSMPLHPQQDHTSWPWRGQITWDPGIWNWGGIVDYGC